MHKIITLALIATLTGCCTEDRMVIELHHVDLADAQAAVIRAEKAIKDFGLEVEDIDYGCRNGTFINITVTGREKSWIDRYNEEYHTRLELEARLEQAKQ